MIKYFFKRKTKKMKRKISNIDIINFDINSFLFKPNSRL